jgi:small-conductance mechanosensitive channel
MEGASSSSPLALVPLGPDGAPGRWPPSLRRHAAGFERGARRLIVLVAMAFWVRGALWQFQVWGPLLTWLERALTAPVVIGGLEFSLGRVLLAVAVLLLIAPMSRAVRFVLREEVLPRMVLPAGGHDSVLTLTHYTVLGSGLVLAARVAGLGATELTVVFGALGVGIGFGL